MSAIVCYNPAQPVLHPGPHLLEVMDEEAIDNHLAVFTAAHPLSTGHKEQYHNRTRGKSALADHDGIAAGHHEALLHPLLRFSAFSSQSVCSMIALDRTASLRNMLPQVLDFLFMPFLSSQAVTLASSCDALSPPTADKKL